MDKYVISGLVGFILGVLAVLLTIPIPKTQTEPFIVTKVTTKTVRDTVKIKTPLSKNRIVKDTVWLDKGNDSSYLLNETVVYSDSSYTAWVSGINPSLDSIHVHPVTHYIYETTTETRYKEVSKNALYGGIGVKYIEKTPCLAAQMHFKMKEVLLGGEVGLVDKTPFYGLNISYKIK